MNQIWEVDGELFATEQLAKEAIDSISKQWGRSVGYSRPKQPRRRQVHTSFQGLLNWSGQYGKWGSSV